MSDSHVACLFPNQLPLCLPQIDSDNALIFRAVEPVTTTVDLPAKISGMKSRIWYGYIIRFDDEKSHAIKPCCSVKISRRLLKNRMMFSHSGSIWKGCIKRLTWIPNNYCNILVCKTTIEHFLFLSNEQNIIGLKAAIHGGWCFDPTAVGLDWPCPCGQLFMSWYLYWKMRSANTRLLLLLAEKFIQIKASLSNPFFLFIKF